MLGVYKHFFFFFVLIANEGDCLCRGKRCSPELQHSGNASIIPDLAMVATLIHIHSSVAKCVIEFCATAKQQFEVQQKSSTATKTKTISM